MSDSKHYYSITRWEVLEEEDWLKITVVSKPLSITDSFYWRNYTTNIYGQGMKRTWWRWSDYDNAPTEEVLSQEACDLLTALVHNTEPVKRLAHYFRIPELELETEDE